MELLDRYLAAVRFWLPKGQRQDILAELTDDIRAEVEDRESGLGRKLTDAELTELLQRRGSPYRVACRYLPQRTVIGPAFFPVYLLILKAIGLFYLLPWLAAWLFMVALLPSYRAAHPGWEVLLPLVGLVQRAVNAFAFATAGVWLAQRSAERTGIVDRWDRTWNPVLPAETKDPLRANRGEWMGQIFGDLVFVLYWVSVFRLPAIPDLRLEFAPILAHTFYWPVLILALASAALSIWNVVRPRWTRRRLFVWLGIEIVEIVQMAILLSAGPLVLLAIPQATPDKVELLAGWVNFAVRLMLVGILVVAAVDVFRAVRLLFKLRSTAAAGAAPAAVRRAV